MLQAEGSHWFNLGRRAVVAIMLGAPAFTSSVGLAQSDFPNKPIHFIVGFAPGGPSDIISRAISAKMGDELGQQVGSKIERARAAPSQLTTWHDRNPTVTQY